MKGVIYKITNKINGKIYVGQTIRSLEDRWYSHVYESIEQKCKTKLGMAIRKYGREAFVVETIEETDYLDEREVYYISLFDSVVNGYNIKIGGNGGPHASSTKNKISRANKKRIWTDKMRKNMSEAIKLWHKRRGFVPRSDETKRKISKGNIGRKMPALTRQIFQEHNKQSSKPIICLDNGKEFPSIMAACREFRLNDGHLRMHLKGKHSHVKGFHFKFK